MKLRILFFYHRPFDNLFLGRIHETKVIKTDKLKMLLTSISRNHFLEGALQWVFDKFCQSNEELFQGFQKYSHELTISKALLQKYINPLSASVALIEKPVN